MATYSDSRVSTYEQCPYKFKLQYIEKQKPEMKNTIEAFLGQVVHKCLEDLYKKKKANEEISKESFIKQYRKTWNEWYSDNVKIVKENQTANNYKKLGEKFLADYYDRYTPFNQLEIIGLETHDKITLSDGNQWQIRIDKLTRDKEGNYYVVDYKTSSRMKSQNEADKDRQLAMYAIWVKNKFKDAKSVKLIWHMLAFNKEVVSERTDEQLDDLQEKVMSTIKEMETSTEFPGKVTHLCPYCEFKGNCSYLRDYKPKTKCSKQKSQTKCK
jgi:RecB family exonuclease